jgi:rhodanese-related sulfurtransferase
MSYAGDLTPREAWELLVKEPAAQLVDVRTQPEWSFVGVPELAGIGRKAILQSWQVYPQMTIDPDFAGKVKARLPADTAMPVLFLCRSGARSRAAAQAMTAAGFQRCYNVAGGFEGDKDSASHRGRLGGWKAENLPWVQE